MNNINPLKIKEIKKIRINKLFGIYNYEINIKNGIAIVIGENGIGKTKILNIVYSVLNEEFLKLNDYNFISIKIYFNKGQGKMFEIKKSDIFNAVLDDKRLEDSNLPISIKRNFYEIRDFILQEKITDVKELFRFKEKYNYQNHSIYNNNYFEIIMNLTRRYPRSIIENLFNIIYSNKLIKNNVIKSLVGTSKILYFPTYRRIEEDILNLGLNIDDLSEKTKNKRINLINFGMEDVKTLFSEKEEEIKNILAQGITTLTGNILNELYNINNNKEKIKKLNIDIESLKIVLNRVSTLFDSKNKEKIIELCENNEINNDTHLSLKSVLLAFIEQYQKQKIKEEILKKFISKCNGYLNKKELVYDNSSIKLYVKLCNGDNIDLSQLSSGEKQIISIFSKIYLNPDENFIILFDEPELSLSINWQKTLISDILNSCNISFLMAVTHSPYIVNKDLQQYANFISN